MDYSINYEQPDAHGLLNAKVISLINGDGSEYSQQLTRSTFEHAPGLISYVNESYRQNLIQMLGWA